MLGSKSMMGLMFIFVTFTILSLIVEGLWLGNTENNAVDWLTSFNTMGHSWFAFPIVVGDFFTKGLPAMLTWDYSFLDSTWGSIVRWILSCTISLGVVWTFLQLTMPIIGQAVSAIAGGLTSLVRR